MVSPIGLGATDFRPSTDLSPKPLVSGRDSVRALMCPRMVVIGHYLLDSRSALDHIFGHPFKTHNQVFRTNCSSLAAAGRHPRKGDKAPVCRE